LIKAITITSGCATLAGLVMGAVVYVITDTPIGLPVYRGAVFVRNETKFETLFGPQIIQLVATSLFFYLFVTWDQQVETINLRFARLTSNAGLKNIDPVPAVQLGLVLMCGVCLVVSYHVFWRCYLLWLQSGKI
jgi:hypothetical protein